METSRIVNILGTEYIIDKRKYDEDENFEKKKVCRLYRHWY